MRGAKWEGGNTRARDARNANPSARIATGCASAKTSGTCTRAHVLGFTPCMLHLCVMYNARRTIIFSHLGFESAVVFDGEQDVAGREKRHRLRSALEHPVSFRMTPHA